MQDGGHQLTWRQTSLWGIASGCGQYRIAKAKTGPNEYRYLAYEKNEEKWQLISNALDSASEAKRECEKWSQNKKS